MVTIGGQSEWACLAACPLTGLTRSALVPPAQTVALHGLLRDILSCA